MADFSFSALANGQTLAFDPASDRLLFDAAVQAGRVTLSTSGTALLVTYGSKTVKLADTAPGQLKLGTLQFANGGRIVMGDGTVNVLPDWYGQDVNLTASTASNQVWGLGGADYLRTGSGDDWLVGNDALTPLQHVSRMGSTGSPTPSYDASISADGNFVSFFGGWTGFGSVNNNATDILTRNLASGTVTNEHRSAAGVQGNSGSGEPVVSADGRYVAFLSASSNLVGTADSAMYDIYLAGTTGTGIERVSVGTGGVAAADGSSDNPDVSGTGRYVVFESSTSNWAADGSAATTDIFLKDRTTGTLTRVSTSTTGGDGNDDSGNAKISNDGRFVVFESAASNLTANDTNGRIDVFVWDRTTGDLVNLSDYMTSARNPSNDVRNADIAWDAGWGGVIVFETAKGLVDADTNNQVDVYAFNMVDETIQLVSSRADGSGVALSSDSAAVSGDGRFVTFRSFSNDLVPGDSNGYTDIFVKDLYTGQIALVSRTPGGAANQHSEDPQISLGGEWIVFESSASNLAGTDDNGGFSDVFRVSNPLLRDTLAGGAGDDTYVLARQDVVVEGLNAGTDTVRSSISHTLAANVENLVLTGSAGLAGTGNALANDITGNSGNNTLKGAAGNDRLTGAGGADLLDGGAGADVAIIAATVGSGSDSARVVAAGANNDTGQDRLQAFQLGQDTLRIVATGVKSFAHGTDTAIGKAGADVAGTVTSFSASTGLIELNQATNNNWSDAGDIAVRFVNPSAALTEANFEAVLQYVLTGTAGADALTGGLKADTLTGGAGGDVLRGGEGNDRLLGGEGNDRLFGGAGKDTLQGDAGADSFFFSALGDLGLGAARDVIAGWNAGDVIDLRFIDANAAAAGDQAFAFRGTAAFTGAGQVRYQGGVLQINTDADAAAEFEVAITGTPPATLVAGSSLLL